MFFEGDAEEALWCVVLTLDFSLRVGRLSEGRKALGFKVKGLGSCILTLSQHQHRLSVRGKQVREREACV